MNSMRAIPASFLTIAILASCAGGEDGAEPAETSEPNRSITADEYYEKVHGAWLGAAVAGAIAEKWTDPIENTIRSDVKGAEEWQIDELARRTVAVGTMMTTAKSATLVEIVSR